MVEASVVICTYNRREILEQCIQKLIGQDYPPENYEILVMDNNSTDGTSDMVRCLKKNHPGINLSIYTVLKQGLSYARNSGIEHAGGRYIFFIDDDALADTDWLAEMTAALNDPRVDGVGGKVVLKFPQMPPRWMVKRFHGWLSEFIPVNEAPYPINDSPWPVGCSMGFRAEVFQKVGGFDPDLGRKGSELVGGEETDLFQRMRSQDMQLWAQPRASVAHVVPSERLEKEYFINLNHKFGEQRVKNLLPLSSGKYLLLAVRFTVEAVANLLLYGIYYVFTGKDRSFLQYVMLTRTFAKIKTLFAKRR